MRAEYFTDKLAATTNYKLIKNAAAADQLAVLLFARDNCFSIVRSPNQRVSEFTRKEMQRLFPKCREV